MSFYNKAQLEYRERCKARIKRQMEISKLLCSHRRRTISSSIACAALLPSWFFRMLYFGVDVCFLLLPLFWMDLICVEIGCVFKYFRREVNMF